MSLRPVLARFEAAGRLVPERVALRYAASAVPERSDAGEPRTELLEGLLLPGAQRLGPFDVRVALDSQGGSVRVDVAVRNAADLPLHLEAVIVGLRWQAPPTAALRFLRHGWQSWSFCGGRALDDAGEPPFPSGAWLRGLHHGQPTPAPDRAGWHESDLVSVVQAAGAGACCLAGVLERGVGTGLVYLRREGDAVRVETETCLERPLASGEELALEPVHAALGTDPSALLEGFASELGEGAGARTGSPFQAGWCSWYQFFHDVSEETLLRNLEALAARRTEIPIEVVQLDDGFQRQVGDWLETNGKFPRGLAPVAAAIRDAGFRPGLWTAPFCVAPESRLFGAHPEWLLRSGTGLHRGLVHPQWSKGGWIHALDPSRDDVCEHLLRTFAALAGVGFTYLKLDFLYVVAMRAEAADPRVTRAGRLRRGLAAIRRGAGGDAFLLGCGCPLGPAVGVVDGMRIGPDVAPAWYPDPGFRVRGIEETQPSTRSAVRSVLARAWMHRRLWLNDPDCLMVRTRGTQLTPPEVGTLAAVIAATGGMLVFSDDVPALGADDVARLRETLALAREVDAAGARGTARALGLVDGEFARGALARTPGAALAALVNAADEPRTLGLELAGALPSASPLPPRALLGTRPPAGPEGDAARVHAALGPHETACFRVLRDPPLAVFCDYDGTFALQDVGSTIARTHAGERRAALWERLARGELTAWEYNMELLDGLALPEEQLDAFLRTVEPDPGAAALLAWCAAHDVPFRILSDGFDRNLDRLQELHRLRFAYDANHLWYENGAWRIAPGHPDPSCDCGTGTCKHGRIQAFRDTHPGCVVVHVGNGRVSDLCAVRSADVVFAKDSLAEELTARGVAFEPFHTLHDVVAGLERLRARLAAREAGPGGPVDGRDSGPA
jgi:alpha-galactosidase